MNSYRRFFAALLPCLSLSLPAYAYDEESAAYVTTSSNKDVLSYIVCLQGAVGKTPKKFSVEQSLDAAEKQCAAQSRTLPKDISASDIRMNIMECGFEPGDASPDAGCNSHDVAKASAPTPAPKVAPVVKTFWEVTSNKDSMGDGTIETSRVLSNNTFNFGFPYQGEQHAVLGVRKHPRWGTDVILTIEKGQFACSMDCTINARFDEGPVRSFEVTGPEDHDTTVRFISNAKTFIAALKKSKLTRIETGFYQEGNRVFEFTTAGLR